MASSKLAKTREMSKNSADPGQALLQGEINKESLRDLSSEWYWEQDEHYLFTQITGEALGRAGLDAQDYLGTAHWDCGGCPVGDDGRWDKHKAILKARQPFTDLLFKRPNHQGELSYISSSGRPVFDGKGRFQGYRGVAKDATRRVQRELRLNMEHEVTHVLAESNSITEATPQIIRVICETLGWSCGAHWVPDERGEAIQCVETWGVASAEIDTFLEATRVQAPSTQLGGLNRRAWIQGEPLWIQDVTEEATFRRAPEALNAGLRSAFAFPIKVGTQSIGVMEFFSREIHQPDAELLNGTRYIGSQIGQFMQRKRAEDEQHRFRAALDVTADLILLVNPTSLQYVDANETACRVLGYSREELLAMGPPDIFSVSREDLAQFFARLIGGDLSTATHEIWYRRKDGSRLLVESVRHAVPSAKGHVIVAVARDITERKRAEQLRALEHAVNRCLADAASVHEALKQVICHICETEGWECGRYFRVDEEARLLRFADAWSGPDPSVEQFIEISRDLVYSPGEGLSGQTWETGQPIWSANISKDPRSSSGSSNKVRPSHKIGAHSAFFFPVMSGGKVIGVFSFASREIREPDERLMQTIGVIGSQIGQYVQRKQAEEALCESVMRFRATFDQAAVGIGHVALDGKFLMVNDKLCDILGYPRAELLQKTVKDISSPQDRNVTDDIHARLLTGEIPSFSFEKYYRRKDGRDVEVRFTTTLAPTAPNESQYEIVVYEDITARRRDEQLLTLEHAVNRCLSTAENLADALKGVLRAVCESEGWECGRYFSLDEKAGKLRFTDAWGIPDALIDRYIAASDGITYDKGVGLTGRVWQSGQPLWSPDVTKDPRTYSTLSKKVGPKVEPSREIGILSALVIPIISEGTTIGTLTFNSRKSREPEERLLQAMRVIGSQIGQFVQRKLAEEVLRESEARFRSLTNLSSDWFWEQDTQFRFTRFEGRPGIDSGEKITGTDFTGKRSWETGIELEDGSGWDAHRALLEAHQPFRDIIVMSPVLQNGKRRYFSLSGEPIFDHVGRFTGYRGVAEEITKRKHAQERIEYLATHDSLTDLPNRAMFSQVLTHAIQSAQRYKRYFAVLFLDLDRFKTINDTLGHEAGDTLLQEMAKRIKKGLRSSDMVARLGGDEFVVLVQEVNEQEEIVMVARKLLSAAMKPIIIQGQECRVTASIGISMYPRDAKDEHSIMKNADMAMYLAKDEGKNNFQFYSKDIKSQSLERLALETSLRHALERDEFFLHYQAKLDLKSGEISGVEALLRWQHPDLGMVSPAQFISLAEETGLIVPISRWVLMTACIQNVAWQREGLPPVCMAVNLSPRQFNHDELLLDLAAVLQETGIDPGLLELEITETMVMGNVERAVSQLMAIKQMGVRLAIDDFGTGYSSLAQIKRFPIDTLKVDRSFIREIPQDTEDMAITEAIIAMGKSLSLTVVAEGVETLEQLNFLRKHACHEMQGFYFSKPALPDKFAELLRTHVPSPQR